MPESGGPARAVLVVDDDSLIRMVLRMAIENVGHDVVDVSTYDELAGLADRPFALCLMDASMPDATLEERLAYLEKRAPDLPVVVISGYLDRPEAARERGLQFLSKPISLDELTATLAAAGLGSPAEMDQA